MGAPIRFMEHFCFLFSKTQESWELGLLKIEFWGWVWEGFDCLDFTILDIKALTVTNRSHFAMHLHLNILKSIHEKWIKAFENDWNRSWKSDTIWHTVSCKNFKGHTVMPQNLSHPQPMRLRKESAPAAIQPASSSEVPAAIVTRPLSVRTSLPLFLCHSFLPSFLHVLALSTKSY